jgi:hypothetical protein
MRAAAVSDHFLNEKVHFGGFCRNVESVIIIIGRTDTSFLTGRKNQVKTNFLDEIPCLVTKRVPE